ncbi:hypothetical protein PoB_000132200 [Plakobranchus ocellatus]|uniref:Uncharacterized protein n=1 Tax=Plakobranchus ocellatus TaxID=259542 RepID=A0AAV3XXF2_9GAST|nr:hypothetical protein PoB_000132200 [Plakobranchus ocellatus]
MPEHQQNRSCETRHILTAKYRCKISASDRGNNTVSIVPTTFPLHSPPRIPLNEEITKEEYNGLRNQSVCCHSAYYSTSSPFHLIPPYRYNDDDDDKDNNVHDLKEDDDDDDDDDDNDDDDGDICTFPSAFCS